MLGNTITFEAYNTSLLLISVNNNITLVNKKATIFLNFHYFIILTYILEKVNYNKKVWEKGVEFEGGKRTFP